MDKFNWNFYSQSPERHILRDQNLEKFWEPLGIWVLNHYWKWVKTLLHQPNLLVSRNYNTLTSRAYFTRWICTWPFCTALKHSRLFSDQFSKSKNFIWVCLRQNYLPKFVYGTWPYSNYHDFFGFQSERVNTWSSGPASWRTWTTSAGPSGLRTTP